LVDEISMLAATQNAVIWETTANCCWKARFYETSELHNNDDPKFMHVGRCLREDECDIHI
jgi:hypothetical protein